MTHKPLVFLDIETTGGSARNSRITEIGAIRVENERVVAHFKELVNPECPVPTFITNLTGISNQMVWDAPTFRSIADSLELFLSDAVFIAHHVVFDYSFIKMEFERIGYTFNMDRACTARLSRRLYPEFKSHALDRIIERMNLTVASRHRAYDDAEVLWKFFHRELGIHGIHLFAELDKIVTRSLQIRS